jgi:predicted flap endonuclease-1-like 5' DNA nuclease
MFSVSMKASQSQAELIKAMWAPWLKLAATPATAAMASWQAAAAFWGLAAKPWPMAAWPKMTMPMAMPKFSMPVTLAPTLKLPDVTIAVPAPKPTVLKAAKSAKPKPAPKAIAPVVVDVVPEPVVAEPVVAAPVVAKPAKAKPVAKSKPSAKAALDVEPVRVGEVESAPPPAAPSCPQLLDAPSGKPDDLLQIKGIGPKINTLLNDLGIFHFAQIAGWTQADAAWIDDKLDFPGRVTREKWVEQAKTLMGA